MSVSKRSEGWEALRVVALSATLFCSCATLQQLRFEEPSLELETLEVTGLSSSGVALVLWLDVFNPNEYDIRTTRVEASLDLEDTHFGSATLEEAVRLAASSHTRVRIPAEFTWEGIGVGAQALLERGAVGYALETRLRVDTSLGGRTLSFRNRGEVPIRIAGP